MVYRAPILESKVWFRNLCAFLGQPGWIISNIFCVIFIIATATASRLQQRSQESKTNPEETSQIHHYSWEPLPAFQQNVFFSHQSLCCPSDGSARHPCNHCMFPGFKAAQMLRNACIKSQRSIKVHKPNGIKHLALTSAANHTPNEDGTLQKGPVFFVEGSCMGFRASLREQKPSTLPYTP